LKELNLTYCELGEDDLVHLIADAMVGNTTMEHLNVSEIEITAKGLDDITRLVASTRVSTIVLWGNEGIFNDQDITQRFVTTLQQKKSSLKRLPNIDANDFPQDGGDATYASIKRTLKRNQHLHGSQFTVDGTATATTTTTTVATTTACNQQHDAEDLEQGHCKVCHGAQQCWSESHFSIYSRHDNSFCKDASSNSSRRLLRLLPSLLFHRMVYHQKPRLKHHRRQRLPPRLKSMKHQRFVE
jgi:hypothetical protein